MLTPANAARTPAGTDQILLETLYRAETWPIRQVYKHEDFLPAIILHILKMYVISVCVCVCVPVFVSVCAYSGQMRVSDPLELEEVKCHLICTLGTKLLTSWRAESARNCCATSLAPTLFTCSIRLASLTMKPQVLFLGTPFT